MASSASGALTKHGFPRGYRFVPDSLEIVGLLAGRLAGTPLPPQLAGIFHDIRILDYHPQGLYEAYKEHEEAGCIYFFSRQEYPTPGGGRAGDAGGSKKRRPVRAANGGGWKPSGGAKQLLRPRNKGGGVAGRMVTMVFYERRRDYAEEKLVKTNWGMHEFTVPLKQDKFSDIAVYRLYKVKNGNKENRQGAPAGEGNEQAAVNVPDHGVAAPVVADEQKPPTWTAAGYPGAGTSTSNQALVAASTSQEPKPFSIDQFHQLCHNQHAFIAAGMPGPSGWAPPAATGMPGPSNWMPPAATNQQDHGAGQSGHVQFVSPSDAVTVPPSAVNPGEQQAPTTAAHGSSDQFGGTSLPSPTPDAESPVPEPLATSTVSPPPPPHAQSAAGGDEMEESPPQPEPLPPPAEDEYDMASVWNAMDASSGVPFDDSYYSLLGECADIEFTMEELGAMEPDNPFSGDGNNNYLQF